MMNKRSVITLLLATLFTLGLSAQVSVSSTGTNPDASAMLDVQSTDKGMLVPRMTTAQRTAISNPATGLLVFDTDTGSFMFYSGTAWLLVGNDNLGNHTATQNVLLNGNYLSGDGGDEGVFVDSSGKVGIGINAPEEKLHISGSARLRNGSIVLTNGFSEGNLSLRKATISGSLPATQQAADQNMQFKVNDGGTNLNTVMTLQGDGNIGIGTTSPSSRLDVAGGNISLNGGYISNDGDNEGIAIGDNGRVGVGALPPLATMFAVSADNNWGTAAIIESSGADNVLGVIGPSNIIGSLFYVNNSNGDKLFHVESDGNVGIGTANPDRPLTVRGNGQLAIFKDDSGNGIEIDGWTNGANLDPIVSGSNFYFGRDVALGNFIIQSGNVGIGTTSPTQAKVVINGNVSNNLSYGYLNSSGNTGTNSGTNTYSLYASHRIAASEFNAHSDIRIKNIKGLSNPNEDLQTLMQIRVTDYTLRDSIAKGNTSYKKVIAQQVAEVYPQAVSKTLTEVVPDIYQRAEVHDGWIMLATDLKVGERVKLITEESADIYDVSAVDHDRFQVDELKTQDSELKTVFVYGREVNDFHTVDYEAIAMLNVSATQEQQRIIEEQQKRIEELENQLKTQQGSFDERIARLEALLSAK